MQGKASTAPGVISDSHHVSFGPFRFDRRGLVLSAGDGPLPVPPKPLMVLRCLIDRAGEVVLKRDLIDVVWEDAAVTENSLVEAVRLLRKALDDDPGDPTYIQTVHRRGYRFIAGVTRHNESEAVGNTVRATSLPGILGRGLQNPARWEGRILRAGVLLLAIVAAAAMLARWRSGAIATTAPTSQATRISLSLPAGLPAAGRVAVSADGGRIAYVTRTGGGTQIVLRELNQFGFTTLAGTEGARGRPSFSPDGRELAFTVRGDAPALWTIKKVSVGGSITITLASFEKGHPEVTWEADGNIYIHPRYQGDIYRVSGDGGELERVRTADRSNLEQVSRPQLLPDLRTLLFTSTPEFGDGGSRAILRALDTGDEETLLDGVTRARYVPTGHLVYTREESLWARPFDVSELAFAGEARRVGSAIGFTVSAGGTLVVHEGSAAEVDPDGTRKDQTPRAVSVDRNGTRRALSLSTSRCRYPSLSPGGEELVLACPGEGATSDIALGNLETGTFTRWRSEADDHAPIWTPDGAAITYSSDRDGVWSIRTRPADRRGPEEILLESEHPLFPSSWSPDGTVLAFQRIHPDTGEDIWMLPLEGERDPYAWLVSPAHESGARFSPDGKWIVYHSRESGAWHVYAEEYDGPGPRIQLSSLDGGWPVWSRNGDELIYLANPNGMPMVVDIGHGPGLARSRPRPLFEGGIGALRDRRGAAFDIAPDGESFVVIGPEQSPSGDKILIVLDWFAELQRLVPTER